MEREMTNRGCHNPVSRCLGERWLMLGWWWPDWAPPNHLHPWQIELSCTDGRQAACPPLGTTLAELGRDFRVVVSVQCVACSWCQTSGDGRGGCAGQGTSARREQRRLLPPNDTYMTVISQFMPRGNELWFKPLEVFLLGLSHSFFYFILSPRFQVQLQTQKCVSSVSAERGFMCSADYCVSLLSTESKL